jgi:hypothetical protein
MKYVKMFGLAVMAAAALMAFAAGTASAETGAIICSTAPGNGEPCKSGHGEQYDGTIHATLQTGKSATLKATNSSGSVVSTVTCTSSTVHGAVTDPANGTGHIDAMTFASCTSAACANGVEASSKASATNPWHSTVTTTTKGVENTNGKMHVENVGGKFVCKNAFGFGFNVTCEYEAASAESDVTGSHTTPIIHAENVPLTRIAGAEFVCGVKGDWSGTYEVTTPSSLIIE